ncbi:unnamed protein product [Trichobilharzia regenti]|nr:unnamed protein product [Trichobilharzia regenti]
MWPDPRIQYQHTMLRIPYGFQLMSVRSQMLVVYQLRVIQLHKELTPCLT